MNFCPPVFLLLIFAPALWAQGAPESTKTMFEVSREIQREVESLAKLDASKYHQSIDGIRQSLEKYIDNKKRVCNGEFSTVIIQNSAEKTEPPHKLTRDEKKLCFRELKAFQITFLNNMYLARKNYLDFLHQKRLEELTLAREEAVKSVQAGFDRQSIP